jgi:hypothetical protein
MSTGISSVGTGYQAYQSSWQSNRQKGQQDFQALATALNSNDLSGAQTAFAALQKDVPGLSSNGNPQGTQAANTNNPLTSDFQNLSQALSSGDLSSAQSAFAKLQQDLQTAVGGHRHHHHHGGGGGMAGATACQSSDAGTNAGSSADQNGSSSQTTLDIQA